jgi:hypothetical protein
MSERMSLSVWSYELYTIDGLAARSVDLRCDI